MSSRPLLLKVFLLLATSSFLILFHSEQPFSDIDCQKSEFAAAAASFLPSASACHFTNIVVVNDTGKGKGKTGKRRI